MPMALTACPVNPSSGPETCQWPAAGWTTKFVNENEEDFEFHCPAGAIQGMSSVFMNDDRLYKFKCLTGIPATVTKSVTSEWVNEKHGLLDYSCPNYGGGFGQSVVTGVISRYVDDGDRKFKFVCSLLNANAGPYLPADHLAPDCHLTVVFPTRTSHAQTKALSRVSDLCGKTTVRWQSGAGGCFTLRHWLANGTRLSR